MKIFASALALCCLIPLQAANLVLNSGFEESPDFKDWMVTEASQNTDLFVSTCCGVNDSKSANFGATSPGFYDTISQTLNTVDGQSYVFSFFLAFDGGGGGADLQFSLADAVDPVADFQVFWNGTLLRDIPAADQSNFELTQFSFNVVGTGSDTISFSGYNVPSFYQLDDVSVDAADSATPEPATWALLSVGGVLVFALRRTAKRP